jgi:hypothetical protein
MALVEEQKGSRQRDVSRSDKVLVAGSGFCTGSITLPSEEVDRAFAMPIGKLRARAGIESLTYATDDETEITLGAIEG